jgi:hypothetical protein
VDIGHQGRNVFGGASQVGHPGRESDVLTKLPAGEAGPPEQSWVG